MPQFLLISFAVYLSIAIAVVSILVFLLGWLFYKYYRLLFTTSFLGFTIPIKLITVALTSLLFGQAIRILIIKPLILLFSFIKILIDNIAAVSKSQEELSNNNFLSLFGQLYDKVSAFLTGDLLQVNVFIALAFMGALTLFINKIFYNANSFQYQMPTIKATGPLQQNVFLFILMAFSLFLVLSAMIAIPVIDTPGDFNNQATARYDSLLNNIKDAKANSAASYKIEKHVSNYVDSVNKIFVPIRSREWNRKATINVINGENDLVSTFFQNRSDLINKLIDLHNKAIENFETLKANTYNDIQFKLKERSSKLAFGKEQDYYLYLVTSYSTSLKKAIDYFKSHESQLKTMSQELDDKYTDIKSKSQLYVSVLLPIDSTLINNAGLIYPSDFFNVNTGVVPYDDIASYGFANTMLSLQHTDKNRTLFERIGDWLAYTNSMDIVLIVGMFGFGLLGATISSFITATKEELHDPTTPLVQNLSVVIIRGFSAAIVIFLATKGSIAVVNNGSNDPNPYVLFFACIVGAVYSERIWGWARTQLSSKYKNDEDDNKAPKEQSSPTQPIAE